MDRPRLVQALAGALDRKLTLLSAPAGYGKTTLLSAWARNVGIPVAWVTLDEADNDPARLFTYLATSLSTIADGLGAATLAVLNSPLPPSADRLATSLIHDLSGFKGELAMVMDDYHFIDSTPVHEAIGLLLRHLPPDTHVVIASRSDPRLPLASLRGAGQLIELRADDLRFTAEETASFLKKSMGLDLPEPALTSLGEKVEGWAVGLQLAGLALRQREDPQEFIDEFSGSHRYVIDFLTDEVLLKQPEEVRLFLLQTSILENLTAALCDAVTGRRDSHELLRELDSTNLFVVPLDERRESYRYHNLFRDALTHRLLRDVGKHAVRELHLRAAARCEEDNLKDEALGHYMKAEAHPQAAELVEAAGMEILAEGQLRRLQRWIDALPVDLVRQRPWLSIQAAWIHNLTGRFDQMELRLQDAERASSSSDAHQARKIRGYVATIRAGAARKQHDASSAIRHLEQALKELPPADRMVRSSAHFNLGSTYLDLGDVGRAEAELRAALQGAEGTRNAYTIIAGRSYLGDTFVLKGQLRRAVRTYHRAIRDGIALNPGKPLPLAAYAHSGLGAVLYEQNALDQAEDEIRQALELGELLSDRTVERRCLPALAGLLGARGSVEAAEATWEQALDLAQGFDDLVGVEYLKASRARMWLMRAAMGTDRDPPPASADWAEEYRSKDHATDEYHESSAQLTLAWLEIVEGIPRQAALRLERLAEAGRAAGRLDCVIRSKACLALAHQGAGASDAARAALQDALTLAAPEGYIRTFVDFGRSMRGLLEDEATRGPNRDYPRTLLGAFPSDARLAGQDALAEPLTNREIEILRLLAAGHSNQEIADRLVIALGTVKQYNHIIFRKLEVRSRGEASRRARELRLL